MLMTMHSDRKHVIRILLLTTLGILIAAAGAGAAEGNQILESVDTVMRSDSRIIEQRMIVYSAAGQSRTREIRVLSQRVADEDQMLVRFTAPADVRGTGLLMLGDDMYLYMPALGRVRRIAGHAKQGSFMGSDFSYKDMEQFGSTGFTEAYGAERLADEEWNNELVYVLRLQPKVDDSDYGHLIMWVDPKRHLPLQIEYHDLDGDLFKTLTTGDLTEIDQRWTAKRMVMENVQSGTKTVMEVTTVEFDVALDSNVFTTRSLERGQ